MKWTSVESHGPDVVLEPLAGKGDFLSRKKPSANGGASAVFRSPSAVISPLQSGSEAEHFHSDCRVEHGWFWHIGGTAKWL